MAQAQGQFTIIDYNDAITLTGYISASKAKTQMYNPDNESYTPDWSVSPWMVLTPSLYVAGTSTDKLTVANSGVQSVTWYDGSTEITANAIYAFSGTYSHILTIKANTLEGLPGKDYKVEIVYEDSTTGLELKYVTSISLSRVVNGSGITDLIVTTPSGNIFKNGEVASLTATAELWRGSTVDTTNVTYKWAIMDPTITPASPSGYDADFGEGWRVLSDTTNKYTGCTSATITVYPGAVDSYATFRCVATDTDSGSTTHNGKFTDVASFVDVTDPYTIVIQSTGGDVFKNGVGSTVLTAKVYQAGAEVDTSGSATYTWSKYNSSGTRVNFANGSQTKTGKTLTVGDNDVDVKATFMVVVTNL